jgi:2'-5' RNA ligase
MIDYSKIEFDDLTQKRLFDFCLTHRLGLADIDDQSSLAPADFKFHVTIMYSKVNNPMFEDGVRDVSPHVFSPEAFDLFGPNNDILVLKLSLDGVMKNLFNHYRDTYGHISEFMPFQPHISIRGGAIGVRDRIASLPMPDFELRAQRLVQKRKED